MQKPNLGWDFHVPPARRMAESNLSSIIHPLAIFQAWMLDLIEHINQKPSRASRGHPPQPIKQWFQLMVRYHKTIIKLVSIQAFQGFERICPTNTSKTSNSTHNFYQASRAFVQPRLQRLVTQPTKGFQSVFPAKASKTSKSAQVLTGLQQRLSNQGFQD